MADARIFGVKAGRWSYEKRREICSGIFNIS